MKKIYRIVLTGGPCAGKSTAVGAIKEYLWNKNIPCLIVPETATELIPNLIYKYIPNVYEFQKLVMKRQLEKEKETFDFAYQNFDKYDKCVIIYDRGIFDNLAYLESRGQFRRILSSFMLNENLARDKYDMVIDLLSLAVCKPEAYNLSNAARKESVEEAALLDSKTSMAWANHHNIKLVSSDVSLAEETRTIINLIDNFLNDKDITERLVFDIDLDNSNLTRYNEMDNLLVTDHYFDIGSDQFKCVLSVNGITDLSYVLQIYKEVGNKKIIIMNELADTDDYGLLCRHCKYLKGYYKREVNFIENKTFYKLNIYEDHATLEVQKNTYDNEIIIPDDLTVFNYVNDNTIYFDSSVEYVKKLVR